MAKGKYTETLNLLDSPFSMRGDLANREPRMLDAWKEKNIYAKVREAARAAEKVCPP